MGGFSFLLHGAVRFCAGYFRSKEMVCLAIFSYFVEVAQIGTLDFVSECFINKVLDQGQVFTSLRFFGHVCGF